MSARRWLGVTVIVIAFVVGVVLQLRDGSLYSTATITTGPEKPVTTTLPGGDVTVRVISTTEHDVRPNWSVAAPLIAMALAGVLLLDVPPRARTKAGHS